ncbi:cytochrome C oxidase subunit IV family protein [Pseudalkalibacillus salsuginis]|uniref:cytochrome C oxidase subunit IV family protein n=1 Tax=Pseudalkalibacillus salsuginis TaxID=2910972 RepID=UPI001F3A27B5|nr:cytochrome C oxidase subunit IV family protein [Pseudalkalibacillus salsuginis]MCF6410037.1 cytochrome C oxidase subunit IV family protein [Pseudalkalibacillus salsuginis]
MKLSLNVRQWIGFFLMLTFSGIAFYLVMSIGTIPLWLLIMLLILAVIQATIQLVWFMDIQQGRRGYKWVTISSGLLIAGLAILYLMLLE